MNNYRKYMSNKVWLLIVVFLMIMMILDYNSGIIIFKMNNICLINIDGNSLFNRLNNNII